MSNLHLTDDDYLNDEDASAFAALEKSNYEKWKADGIARAAKLQSLYNDAVGVQFNHNPSEAKFFIIIGVNMEGDAIRLLDLAKSQGII